MGNVVQRANQRTRILNLSLEACWEKFERKRSEMLSYITNIIIMIAALIHPNTPGANAETPLSLR